MKLFLHETVYKTSEILNLSQTMILELQNQNNPKNIDRNSFYSLKKFINKPMNNLWEYSCKNSRLFKSIIKSFSIFI